MTAAQSTHDTALEPDWLPEPGDTVAGKYAVERVLGHGGMGVVIAARHQQLGHRVAIKCLRPAFSADPAAVARFTREAQAAVALRGEHVARVQDVGTLESGAPYMIMEFLSGTDLGAMIEQSGPVGVEDAVDFVLQASEAIAEAHALGIVHRDLKPSNLFVSKSPDGSSVVKVLDFGIAKALETATGVDAKLTATGVALGTPVYMSPEQIRDAKTVDRRTDIWALGAVLHELLAGSPPFAADTLPALCAAIVADPPPPLSKTRSDVPAGLAAVVERCLRKPVDERFPDVGALAHALAPFARPESRVHVDRIARIVARGGPSATAGADLPREVSREEQAIAPTMASSPGPSEALEPLPAKQTAAAWQTDRGSVGTSRAARVLPPARRTWLAYAAAGGLAGAVVLAVWLGIARNGPHADGAAASAAGSAAAPVDAAQNAEPEATATDSAGVPGSAELRGSDGGLPAATPASSTARPAVPAATSRSTSPPTALPSPATATTKTRPPSKPSSHDSSLIDRK